VSPKPPRPALTLPIADALRASAPLGRLSERLRLSNTLFEAVAPAVPAALTASLRPGPVDDEGWSLLCDNAAVAAKLRQLVPRLEQRLRELGHPVAAIRIKVQPH
jgi:Dna[CI] antecedent DciA-like protein